MKKYVLPALVTLGIPLCFFAVDYILNASSERRIIEQIDSRYSSITDQIQGTATREEMISLIASANQIREINGFEPIDISDIQAINTTDYGNGQRISFIDYNVENLNSLVTSAGLLDIVNSEVFKFDELYNESEVLHVYDLLDGRAIVVSGLITGGSIGNFYRYYLVNNNTVDPILNIQGDSHARLEDNLTVFSRSWGYMFGEHRTYWTCEFRLNHTTLQVEEYELISVSGFLPQNNDDLNVLCSTNIE